MDKNPAEILIVFLYPMVQLLYVGTGKETQDRFFQLAGAFAGDDLDEIDLLAHRLFHNPAQLGLDRPPVTEYIMQVQFNSRHNAFRALSIQKPFLTR
jgi:hypothetical protein